MVSLFVWHNLKPGTSLKFPRFQKLQCSLKSGKNVSFPEIELKEIAKRSKVSEEA